MFSTRSNDTFLSVCWWTVHDDVLWFHRSSETVTWQSGISRGSKIHIKITRKTMWTENFVRSTCHITRSEVRSTGQHIASPGQGSAVLALVLDLDSGLVLVPELDWGVADFLWGSGGFLLVTSFLGLTVWQNVAVDVFRNLKTTEAQRTFQRHKWLQDRKQKFYKNHTKRVKIQINVNHWKKQQM